MKSFSLEIMFKRYANRGYRKEKYYIQKAKCYNEEIEKLKHIKKQSIISRRIYYPLLQEMYNRSGYNFYLISNQFPYEDYVWWSYTNYNTNRTLRKYIDDLEMNYKTDSGCPRNIIRIVEIINMNTYFNQRIRYFFTLLSWAHNIFIYYNRFYRYLKNDKLFGKKTRIAIRHGHKLHFIRFISYRQNTGIKINKNNLKF